MKPDVQQSPFVRAARTPASRNFALAASLAAFALAVGCGANSSDEMSTETGNPPLLASDKVAVTPNEDTSGSVTVTGEAGAVDPGGTDVQVRNSETGETTTVTSNDDGSFAAAIEGTANDEYSVRAVSGFTSSTELELTASSEGVQAACEKICAGPRECGANETLFPVAGCDCDGSVCECSGQECVAQCLSDMAEYDTQGVGCSEAAAHVRACIMAAPCDVIASRDEEAILAVAECQSAFDFERSCAWAGSSNQCSSSSSGSGSGGDDTPTECEVIKTCGTTNYGLSCNQEEDDTYDCTCRENGIPSRGFSAARGCGAQGSASTDESTLQMRWYCGYPITLPAAVSSICQVPDYAPGDVESPGACAIQAQCDSGAFSVTCSPRGDGTECTCTRDNAPQASASLDADGCLTAKGIHNEGPESAADVLSALAALCEANLQLE